jgi:uncharacterized protein (UPF0548 family)
MPPDHTAGGGGRRRAPVWRPLWEGDHVFVTLGRPSDEQLARLLDRLRATPLTYPEHGRTLARRDELPAGYHHVRAARDLGTGDAVWRAACDGIRSWRLHRGSGLRIAPADPPIAVGTEVVTDVALAGPVHILAACRVVDVVDEPARFGFAYGTLAVHPAQGEEAFVVERGDDGVVRLTVTAFSRGNGLLMRLGGPVVRRQQGVATEGYLDALQRHVDAAVS